MNALKDSSWMARRKTVGKGWELVCGRREQRLGRRRVQHEMNHWKKSGSVGKIGVKITTEET